MPRLLTALALACAFLACVALIWAPVTLAPPLVAAALAWALVVGLVVAVLTPTLQRRGAPWIVAALALALSGCGTLQGMSAKDRKEVLAGAAEHIEKCDRDYWANTGLPGSAGFRITCRQPQDTSAMVKAMAEAMRTVVTDALAAAAATPPAASPK
jgi:hypothetical protein